MLTAAAPARRPSPLLTTSAWGAGALLSLFGLRPTARRARWLATVTAHWATRHDAASVVVESARRRLASVTDGALVAHRASRETNPRIPRLRAALPTLAQSAQDAAAQVTRLEAMVPPGAVEEAPSWVLRFLCLVGVISESWITYGSLGATPLAETPIALLCSSLAAAPIAAALLSRAGGTIRRSVWRRRIEVTDAALVILALAVASFLGLGLTLSRVADVQEHRGAMIALNAGLQAVIMTLPLWMGYESAAPTPGLPKARRLRDRAIRQHDAAIAELRRLEAEHAQREVELLANAEATHAEFERTLSRFGGAALAPRTVTQNVGAYPALIEGSR
jgi:hypothetical protein